MPERVCHIVPAVPPEFNGLGDYARQLWRHWPEPRPEWHVAALRVPAGAAEAWPGVAFHPFRPNAESLLEALLESRADVVALHYVGHGYHPKGVPLWLPKALARWKAATGGRLVTFFHELWATGPPWSSANVLAGLAILQCVRLLRLSVARATSCFRYERMLSHLTRGKGNPVRIPVGTNIEPGRPMDPRPWPPNGSQVRVCVFGTPGTRRRALRMLQPALEDLVREGLVRSLVLVGTGPQDSKAEDAMLREWAGQVAVEENFDLGESDVSEVLASCDLSLVSNKWEILHKSGVYAASIAHGLACVIPDCQAPPQRPVLLASEAVQGGVPEDWIRVRLAEQQRLSWPSIVSQWRTMT